MNDTVHRIPTIQRNQFPIWDIHRNPFVTIWRPTWVKFRRCIITVCSKLEMWKIHRGALFKSGVQHGCSKIALRIHSLMPNVVKKSLDYILNFILNHYMINRKIPLWKNINSCCILFGFDHKTDNNYK